MIPITTKILYDQDFSLWVEETVSQLKAREFNQVDWENLIEEIESLARKDKRELKNKLRTLFEHILKRQYVTLPDCYRGWEGTISRTQTELKDILEDSPSLRNFLVDIAHECYQDSVRNLRKEYDALFPDNCPFRINVDSLLTEEIWKL
jgi:hypothetical protein